MLCSHCIVPQLASVDPACSQEVVDLPSAPGDEDEDDEEDDEPDAECAEGHRQGREAEEVGLLDHQEPDLDLEQEPDGDEVSTASESEEENPKVTASLLHAILNAIMN